MWPIISSDKNANCEIKIAQNYHLITENWISICNQANIFTGNLKKSTRVSGSSMLVVNKYLNIPLDLMFSLIFKSIHNYFTVFYFWITNFELKLWLLSTYFIISVCNYFSAWKMRQKFVSLSKILLPEKCACSKYFWCAFSRIQTEYVRMRGNTDQKKFEYGHFSRSVSCCLNQKASNASLSRKMLQT